MLIMNYQTILVEEKQNYIIVRLNRPDKLNALNFQMFNELDDIIRKVELNKSIFGFILTGSGDKAFAAGADIKELHESDERSGKLFSEHGSKVMARLAQLRIPTIAAVNGFALGGGCELTLACHIRFASENAKFGQPEVNLGIIPGYGATQRLTHLVGYAKAIELIISANIIDAYEAEKIGLVNKVFPHNELMQKSEEFLQNVLTKGQIAVSAAIDCINASMNLSIAEGLTYESRKFGQVCGTKDFKEGTLAFLEKRKPNFIGE